MAETGFEERFIRELDSILSFKDVVKININGLI